MRTFQITGFALVLSLCSLTAAAGQAPASAPEETTPSPAYGVSGGLNMGVGSYGFAGQLSVGVSRAAGDFIARSAGTSELTFLTTPPRSVSDVAVLYGRRASGSRGWLRLAAGPAYVMSVDRGGVRSCALFFCDYEEERSSTVGLALQLDGVWAIAHHFGLGVSVFGDANAEASFWGATLGVYFGRLR